MNRIWAMPLVEFFWLRKLECLRLWRRARRWRGASSRSLARRANSFVDDCERLEPRMVLSMATVALNPVTLDLGGKSASFPLPMPAAWVRDSSSATAHLAGSLHPGTRTADVEATVMSSEVSNAMSSPESFFLVVNRPAIRVVASASVTSTIGHPGRASDMNSLTWFLGVRSPARDDVSFQKTDVLTKVATQTAERVSSDIDAGRVQTPLRFSELAERPTALTLPRNPNEMAAFASMNVPQAQFVKTLTTRSPTRLIDVPVGNGANRPATQLQFVIPAVRTVLPDPIPLSAISGESVIPRPAPPAVPLASNGNVNLPSEFTLIDQQFASDQPAELDVTPPVPIPVVEPTVESITKAITKDVLEQSWWKALEDPKVWLAALITLASAFTFWRFKSRHRLANS